MPLIPMTGPNPYIIESMHTKNGIDNKRPKSLKPPGREITSLNQKITIKKDSNPTAYNNTLKVAIFAKGLFCGSVRNFNKSLNNVVITPAIGIIIKLLKKIKITLSEFSMVSLFKNDVVDKDLRLPVRIIELCSE